MQRTMLKSKLHRARVTNVLIDYEGSIEIDEDLMDEVGIITYEQVHIYNISNGHRFITYAIPGSRGSRVVSINGAAARLAHINDRIIIVAYGIMSTDREVINPKVIVLDENNQVVEKKGSLAS
ncbi:MAG: aspartate 1-decarboxylase [Nitrospinaceae bacterium]|nr:aspartate 1-decarboxylase [Nitrospinaceae bacterium]|tara:strand:- start:823 stop:1191 length:369 start_codon:yes stop_codon:yes gene_type:complete